MHTTPIRCPLCDSTKISKNGKDTQSKQRYICNNKECGGKSLLSPFGITTFYTDDWSTYERNLAGFKHVIGKKNTQRIERKNLTLRTRIKRLCRKTICYSKSIAMHDIVIGLVINILEFGLVVKGLLPRI